MRIALPRLALLGVLALLATACGSQPGAAPGASGPEPGAGRPTAVPPADGRVQTRHPATVIDNGGGAELCLGGVAESYPPQCGGPRLTNWDWADHEGHFEQASGVRWGDFHVVGGFDGESVTISEVTPADEYDLPRPAPEDPFATPCEEPDDGWVVDRERVDRRAMDSTFRAVRRLPDYSGSFLDNSRDPRSLEHQDAEAAAGEDDVSSAVVNVRVTDDLTRAERLARETWGGGLCVTRAQHTEAELRRVQQQLGDLPGMLSSGVGDDVVEVDVVHDDGSIRAWADREFGEGVVIVCSALVPA